MNLSATIIPKSDQLNSDELLTGPKTIRISSVKAGSAEQPVIISYDGDNGRPYKPSKSMRRVLVSLWGAEADAYVGRCLTLYRDPAIRFGSDPVGGIRISHASHIAEPVSISLTESRGKRKPFRVDVLNIEEPHVNADELEYVGDAKASLGTDALKAWFESLTKAEKHAVKDQLEAWKKQAAEVRHE